LRFFFGLANDRRDRLKLFGVTEIHQFYAHRISASFANFFDPRTHHLALVGDEHHLITLADGKRANHIAGFLTGFHGDNTFAAT
jgi:hypothetical protein